MKKIVAKATKKTVSKATARKKQPVVAVKKTDSKKTTSAQVVIQNKLNYTPKVSVIVPVYNVEQYLPQCLDSILNQTLKEIEVICVDDGSTDNSLKILKEYAKKDNRIMVVSRENKGVGYTRNQAIKLSKGDFVAFMDPDDYYPSKDVLNILYTAAINNNVKISGGSLIVYDESLQKEIKRTDFYNFFSQNTLVNYEDFQYDYGYQRFIFERQMLMKNDVFFPEYKRFQDPPFMVKAFICAKKFYAISDYTYTYRWAHQDVNWTEERVFHLLSGLRDDFNMAVQNNLEKLYDLTLMRIKKEYKAVISGQTSDRINQIKQEIMDICLTQTRKRYKKDLTKPKVSVVLPIYNAEPYLRECLDSVANQTLKDIEIICVNDGSTDNSLNIIKEYAARDNRVKYIDKPNAGYGQTMNAGIDLARGEYIGIVEPDDFVKPDMYETLYNKAKESTLDIVKANLSTFEEKKGKRIFNDIKYMKLSDKYNVVDTPFELQNYMITSFNTCCAIYRRDMLTQNNIRYNETPGAAYQDTSFWFKTHCIAKKMVVLDKQFYMYRQDNPNQSIRNPKLGDYLIAEYSVIYEFLKDNKLEKFLPLYFFRKVSGFFWYLDKLSGEYKNAFLENIHTNFINMTKHNKLDFKYFDKNTRNRFEQVISDEYIKFKHICVSIIICAYNGEEYLQECLDSVINQTLRNIEIICVNDGSTDNTLNILNKYAKQDDRIVVINHKNIGLATSRNQAIDVAHGEFVLFVDCDDYIRQDTAEILYHYATNNNSDMVSFSGYNFNNEDKTLLINRYWNFEWMPNNFNQENFCYKDCLSFMHELAVSSCLTFYKRNFINKYGIKFPDDLCFEDNVFFLKSFIQADTCSILNDKLYYRRIHSLSITQNWSRHFYDYLQITKLVLGYLKQHKINKKTIKNYVTLYCGVIKNTYAKLNDADKQKYNKEVEKILKEYSMDHNNFKSYLLFPYYLLANMWMNLVSLPFAKFRRHTKQVWYSHSARGRMDKILQSIEYAQRNSHKQIMEVTNSLLSIKEDVQQQIDSVKNEINAMHERMQKIESSVKTDMHTQIDSVKKDFAMRMASAKADIKYLKDNFEESKYTLLSQIQKGNKNIPLVVPYKTELEQWYLSVVGKQLNLDNPQTFNEKIQWLKLFDSTPIKTRLTDKYLVREWIAEKIGDEYLIPLLGVYDSFNEIDFDKLPNQFVIKCNHGSGYNIVVKDKSKLDLSYVKQTIDKWMAEDFAFRYGYELHYHNIKHKIIIEQYLSEIGDALYDYRFFCCYGKVLQIWVDVYSGTPQHKRKIYDKNWNELNFRVKWPRLETDIPKPKNLDKMIALAQKLSKDFALVRVDFYDVNNKIYFGEMTFTSMSGVGQFIPNVEDLKLGKLVSLPKQAYNVITDEYYKIPNQWKRILL